MLVLSRRTGERIQIGGGIEVEVVAVQGSRVKLGITCPREIPILRAELAGRAANDPLDISRACRPVCYAASDPAFTT
jgi:carbon storage regulator